MDLDIVRLFLSFLVGSMLCVSGSFSQVLTQNPLASPSTLGIQAIALLFYIFSFMAGQFLGIENSLLFGIVIFHFIFLIIVYLILRNEEKVTFSESFLKKMILIGLCLNLAVSSFYSLIQFSFLNLGIQFPSQLWFGSFRFSDSQTMLWVAAIYIIFTFLSFSYAKKLRLSVLGQDFSRLFIKNQKRQEKIVFLLIFYSSVMVTLLFGVFSFIGLIFPHILRSVYFFRKDLLNEVVYGGLLAGLCFCVIDQLCYQLPIHGAELPVGMVTSFLGPIVFVFILMKNTKTIKNIY